MIILHLTDLYVYYSFLKTSTGSIFEAFHDGYIDANIENDKAIIITDSNS